MKPKKPAALFIAGSIVVAAAAVWFASSINNWQLARFESDGDLSLPSAESDSSAHVSDETGIIVSIDESGGVSVDNEPVTDKVLIEKLIEVAKVTPDRAVILRAAATGDFQDVMNVLDEIKAAGIWNVSFATTKS